MALFWVAARLVAQTPVDFEASVKAAMAPSIAQQRAAIRKQAIATGQSAAALADSSAPSSFFTIPFSTETEGAADCDPLPRKQLDSLITEASRKTGVAAQLVRAVIDRESGGRPCALSAQRAEGLMQLMPVTAEEFDVDDPFDPQQNVEAGAKLLKSLLERYNNDPALALGAYNAGSSRVDQEQAVPQIPETVDYVTAILDKLGLVNRKGESAAGSTANSGWPTALPPLKDF